MTRKILTVDARREIVHTFFHERIVDLMHGARLDLEGCYSLEDLVGPIGLSVEEFHKAYTQWPCPTKYILESPRDQLSGLNHTIAAAYALLYIGERKANMQDLEHATGCSAELITSAKLSKKAKKNLEYALLQKKGLISRVIW